MKLVLAQDNDDASGHKFVTYEDALRWFSKDLNESYKRTRLLKSGDSTEAYALLETSSLKELLKFEDQFSIVRVEENEHNKQVPCILVMV